MTNRLTKAQAMQLAPVSKTARVLRHPQYDFAIQQRPFAITPFMLAPVLPGESLQFLQIQARTVTEPINSALLGMWLEHYVFYVKHRDLTDIATDLENMVLSNTEFPTTEGADDTTNYAAKGCVDWVHYCLKRVTEEYFRDEGESWDTYKIGSYLPAAKVSRGSETWMQSICDTADLEAIDTSLDLDVQSGSPDYVTLEGSDVSELLRQYEYLRDMQLVNMSYEDWLKTYGVSAPPPEASHRPELLRYLKSWNMPSNVMAADATPRYGIMWSTLGRADKPRLFKEPGFIFGVTVLRPKAYFNKQHGQAAGLLTDAYGWLPAMLANQKESRLKSFSHTDLVLPDFTEDFTIDLGDMYLYGDQFTNYDDITDVPGNVDLPASTTNKKYPDGDDADSYFVTPETNNYATTDGTVRLSIKTRTRDVTP